MKRLVYGSALVLLSLLATLVVFQGSFSLGNTTSLEQTSQFWVLSTLVFIVTVALGFMLVRTGLKLYIERHTNREGSRIKTKLVIGALILSVLPAGFLFVFSYQVLNYNIQRWFSRPAENVKIDLGKISAAIERESMDQARALARWLSVLPETKTALDTGAFDRARFEQLCQRNEIDWVELQPKTAPALVLCNIPVPPGQAREPVTAHVPIGETATLGLRMRMAIDMNQCRREFNSHIAEYDEYHQQKRRTRTLYSLLILLITLFVLFVANWVALFFARQITVPISALLAAAQEVRRGNLAYRVHVGANDELAGLVRAFNEMTQELDANSRELERRRRFTEAILESIPTGVISVSADGRVRTTNRALEGLFGMDTIARAGRLSDIFAAEDLAEIRYLMNRSRRTGVAGSQLEIRRDQHVHHISVTVAALGAVQPEERTTSGFVIVLEDSSDLLKAQKQAAWHEVARRVAHEIKNPLTPISLSADRIARHLDKPTGPDRERVLRDCSATISAEVESLRTLVDEFAQFARLPAVQRAPADLNEVVESSLGVFQGRLDGIQLEKRLTPNLPPVSIDREQFRRVVVNLIDNAAEAMQDSHLRLLLVATQAPTPDLVELVITDTGCGISPADKEKLFLPYFSTKNRGTGLGLAIVSHILAEHNASIRVEDNQPAGARFIVELAGLAPAEPESRPLEARA